MRVIDVHIKESRLDALRSRAEEAGHQLVVVTEGRHVFARILVLEGDPDDSIENLRDALRESCDDDEHYVVFEPVAVEPRDEDENKDQDESVAGTEEIEQFVKDGARLTRSFIAFSILSGVLASAGLVRDNVAVLVGAMVIAPLFRPMALTGVAVILGRHKKALMGLLWLLSSLFIAAIAGFLVTLLTPDSAMTPLLEARAGTSAFDLVVAIAAGVAMSYALVKKDALAMVGIVVAASLMPVAATLGVVAAFWDLDLVGGAFFTLASNICGILLGLVVGLRIQGLHTTKRDDDRSAKALTKRSILAGIVIVLGLAGFSGWSFWQSQQLAADQEERMSGQGVLGELVTTDGRKVLLVDRGASVGKSEQTDETDGLDGVLIIEVAPPGGSAGDGESTSTAAGYPQGDF